jgi:hypothetical protein
VERSEVNEKRPRAAATTRPGRRAPVDRVAPPLYVAGMTRVLTWMLALGLVFAVIATLLAPSVLGWYFTPPQGGVVMMKGDDAVRWGMRRLIQTQFIAFVIGAVLGLLIGLKWRPKSAALPPPRASSTPAAAGPGRTPTSV